MERPLAKVKAMFDPLVVVMVLPLLYEVCKLTVAPEHCTTSFELFTQSNCPLAVVNPVKLKNEVPLVATVTLFPLVGVKVALPAVMFPLTVNGPLMVVSMLLWPILIAEVLLVPILTVPLVAPNPALMETLPPNPPVPDSAPAVRFNAPPFAVFVALFAG